MVKWNELENSQVALRLFKSGHDMSRIRRRTGFYCKTKGRFGQHRLSLHPKYNDADDFITNVWNDKEVCQYDKVSDKYKKWYHFFGNFNSAYKLRRLE